MYYKRIVLIIIKVWYITLRIRISHNIMIKWVFIFKIKFIIYSLIIYKLKLQQIYHLIQLIQMGNAYSLHLYQYRLLDN